VAQLGNTHPYLCPPYSPSHLHLLLLLFFFPPKMSFLRVFRVVVFSVASVFAVIVLAMGGYLISVEVEAELGYIDYVPMAIASGTWTVFVLPAFLIVDMTRQGAWTSMIVSELAVLSVLWMLWMTTGILTSVFWAGSGCSDLYGVGLPFCQVSTGIEAISYLTFLLILAYVFTLLVFTLIAASRGHSVWTSSVKNTDFFARGVVQPQLVPVMTAPYPSNSNFGQQQPFVQVQSMYSNDQPGVPMRQMPGTPPQQYAPQGVPMV
jgi:hypothetical protein